MSLLPVAGISCWCPLLSPIPAATRCWCVLPASVVGVRYCCPYLQPPVAGVCRWHPLLASVPPTCCWHLLLASVPCVHCWHPLVASIAGVHCCCLSLQLPVAAAHNIAVAHSPISATHPFCRPFKWELFINCPTSYIAQGKIFLPSSSTGLVPIRGLTSTLQHLHCISARTGHMSKPHRGTSASMGLLPRWGFRWCKGFCPCWHWAQEERTLTADGLPMTSFSLAAASASPSTPFAATASSVDKISKTSRHKNTWHTRFSASVDNRTGGYLFFKHIRKAGGTTLRSYFRHVLRYHGHDRTFGPVLSAMNRTSVPLHLLKEYDAIVTNAANRSNTQHYEGPSRQNNDFQVYYIEQEFDAMDHQCPARDPRWQHSLRIVTLRHPVERILSEFFYSGPGRFHPVNRTRLSLNDTAYIAELSHVLQTMLPEWTGNNYARRRETRENRYRTDEIQKPFGRYYTDNFQLRALAGCSSPQCLEEIAYNRAERLRNDGQFARLQSHRHAATPIKDTCTLHFVTDERMLDVCNKVNRSPECPYGCDAPCFYPTSAWYKEVNATHLRWAKETLGEFDVILLMETMNDRDQSAWLSDVLGVPRNASFVLFHGGKMRNSGVEKEGYREKTRFYRDLLEKLAADVNDLLHKENKLEIEFFEYAVELNRVRTDQWKRDVNWVDD